MARKAKDQIAAVLLSPQGQATLVPQSDARFRKLLATATGSISPFGGGFYPSRRRAAGVDSPYIGRRRKTSYQNIISLGTFSPRDLLVPAEDDFDGILERVDFYNRIFPWINRALRIRAGAYASEMSVDAPGKPEQTDWMLDLYRSLNFFSFIREFFWQLEAHNQAIVLWKTLPDSSANAEIDTATGAVGRKPASIECADLRVHQPRGPGVIPRIVVLPYKDERLVKLVNKLKLNPGDAEAKKEIAAYPPPLIDAVKKGGKIEVRAEELEPHGYHFEYAAINRRHYEDCAFPGMYSIFPDLEIVAIAQDTDINALHHYKVGFVLIRLGPQNPSGTDLPIMATEKQLSDLNDVITAQAKNKLPSLVGRGDLRIDWVVPPADILAPAKYEAAMRRIFDWLGIPKIAWPGQDFQGAFAAAQTTLKFIQQESKDVRDVARELFERWFFERARESNKFEGAIWPTIRFDPNALVDQMTIQKWAQLFMQFGGASEQTILEMADLDVEVEAARRQRDKETRKKFKVDWAPAFVPTKAPQAEGRPPTVAQPTPESGTLPQTRPSRVTGDDQPDNGGDSATEDTGDA